MNATDPGLGEVRAQRRPVLPFLIEKQPHRVLAIDMHRMRDAARLFPGALDMFETEAADFVEAVFPRQNAAGDQNHFDTPHEAHARCVTGGNLPGRIVKARLLKN